MISGGKTRRRSASCKIRAMHAQIRRAEEALRHGQLAHNFAGVPFAIQSANKAGRRCGACALLDADLAQHLHRVGHHLDARADARKARRLLVDLHVHADARSVDAAVSPPIPAPTIAIVNCFWPIWQRSFFLNENFALNSSSEDDCITAEAHSEGSSPNPSLP